MQRVKRCVVLVTLSIGKAKILFVSFFNASLVSGDFFLFSLEHNS